MNITFESLKTAYILNAQDKQEISKRTMYFMALAMVAVLANKVLAIFTGGLARTIAVIAVIACGIAALAGKLSWDWAIKIIIGLVLIFGAAAIVDYIISAVGS